MDSQPTNRWITIDHAPIGTPCAYLDTFGCSLALASATIITVLSENSDDPQYRPIFHGHERPDPMPKFRTLALAQQWTEQQIPTPLATVPIQIFPEYWILSGHDPQPGEILISITEPGQHPLTPRGTYAAIYHLPAWDIPYTIQCPKRGSLHPTSDAEADTLIQFLLKHRHRMTALTVHCHAGISRSPAVAIAVSEWIETTPSTVQLVEQYPAFNRTLYRTMCQRATAQGLIQR